jgi:hypothetical protein
MRFVDLENIVREYIEKNNDLVNSESYDCSELAEDIQEEIYKQFNLKGCILTFTPQNKRDVLHVLEKNKIKDYQYHSVLLFNGLIVDIRSITNIDNIVFKSHDDYFQELKDLNPDIEILEFQE